MAKQQATVTKQTLYLTVFIVFIAGFLAGIAYSVFKTGGAGSPGSTVAQQSTGSQQESQAIINLEAAVTANPEDFNAWTQLGHLYFDTGQYQKAIGAYTRSLELHSGSANLWTDLGVMYRRTGEPEKAIESFDKAIAMDPSHTQSRFNKGVVLLNDLDRAAEAIAMWRSVLQLDPGYQTAGGTSLAALLSRIEAENTGDGNG